MWGLARPEHTPANTYLPRTKKDTKKKQRIATRRRAQWGGEAASQTRDQSRPPLTGGHADGAWQQLGPAVSPRLTPQVCPGSWPEGEGAGSKGAPSTPSTEAHTTARSLPSPPPSVPTMEACEFRNPAPDLLRAASAEKTRPEAPATPARPPTWSGLDWRKPCGRRPQLRKPPRPPAKATGSATRPSGPGLRHACAAGRPSARARPCGEAAARGRPTACLSRRQQQRE